jgi:hypothetical protein
MANAGQDAGPTAISPTIEDPPAQIPLDLDLSERDIVMEWQR